MMNNFKCIIYIVYIKQGNKLSTVQTHRNNHAKRCKVQVSMCDSTLKTGD